MARTNKDINTILMADARKQMSIPRSKWRRNGRIYFGSPMFDITNTRDATYLGYQYSDYAVEPDIGPTIYQNVIKSCIDTKTSRMANNKVRPAILPNGKVNFSTRRKARVFRKVIDRYFQDNSIHKLASRVYRSSLIFERSYIWVDHFTQKCYEVYPWEVGLIDVEQRFGATKLLLRFENFPTSKIKLYTGNDYEPDSSLFRQLEIWYDITNKLCSVFVTGKLIKTYKYEADEIPIIEFCSTPAINGIKTVSIVDELSTFQDMLNNVNSVINEAASLSPGFYIIGPESDDIDKKDLGNNNGRYIGYQPGTTNTISFETPRFIDPEWFTLREDIIRSAYEIVGVSQQNAINRNPLGANASGKALETMENTSDQRFQVEIDQFVKNQEKIARLIVTTFDPDIELSDNMKIKDIRDDYNNLRFEFVSLSWMSRDPQTRYQEIQNLIAMGIIPANKALELMEFGDLTAAYDRGSANQDAIDTMIEKAIEEEIYEYTPYLHPEDVISSILLEYAQEYASQNKDTDRILERLDKLLFVIQNYLESPGVDLIVPQVVDTEANLALQSGDVSDTIQGVQ